MDIYKDFNIEIDEKDIVRLLGYKNSNCSSEILDLIRTEINYCLGFIKPIIAYEQIKIIKVENDKVLLENNVTLEGKFIADKLSRCQYVVVSIATIGAELDPIIRDAFERDDLIKGMIADNIANCALSYVSKSFWAKLLSDIEGTTLGITSSLSPGEKVWPMSEQQKIFQCLKTITDIEVTLTESNIMLPLKSTSAIYGLGEGIGITKNQHICSECSLKNCSYRIKEKFKVNVHLNGSSTMLKVESGSNLLEILRASNISPLAPCGGKGSCGKCRLIFLENAPLPTSADERHLSENELQLGIRLACGISVKDNMEISVENSDTNMKILTEGKENAIVLDTIATKIYIEPPKPTIDDQRSDYKRISDALNMDNLVVEYDILPSITETLKKSNFKVTTCLYENTLLQLEEGDTRNCSFGVAVDIGTTTIACYLVNLTKGETIDTESQVNKQNLYGADIISRIGFTIDNKNGTEVLKSIVIEQINNMLSLLCKRNNIISDNIYNMTIVGNTTMLHFLLGLPSENISLFPFIPVSTSAVDYKARDVGIKINGYISLLPGIASYIGSDITAGILASGMVESNKYSLLLDLGTNGEIALGNSEKIICCATAAGPAFEGANIKCGIAGIKGAINTINLNSKKIYTTIGGEKPQGICGSAVLDAVSEFRKHNVIDETGRMFNKDELNDNKFSNRIAFNGPVKEFILQSDLPKGESIVFTQKDVREVQLAKAAIASGIQILIKEAGITYDDIENVYIAGGFGSFMNIESAVGIGMLPKDLKSKMRSIGNSAGTGAKMYLLSKSNRKKANIIVKLTKYIELSTRDDFQDYYMNSMML